MVPPALSIVKFPLEVSISLSPVMPTWMLPAVAPVDVKSPIWSGLYELIVTLPPVSPSSLPTFASTN